jgi:hypothetical protein
MPSLTFKNEPDNGAESDSNLTDFSTSDLSLSSINISATPSLSNIHDASSSPVLRVSSLEDIPDLSLQDSFVLSLPDSPHMSHRSIPISVISTSDHIVDDFEKYVILLTEKSDFVFHRPVMSDKSSVVLDDDAFEREVQNTLNGCDIQQQIRTSISAIPGAIEVVPPMSVPRRRSRLFSKLPLSYFSGMK